MARDKAAVLKELQRMPNIGPSIALDLWDLGVRKVSDLKGRDPHQMYEDISRIRLKGSGYQPKSGLIDRCQLYVFRAAVYYADNEGKVEADKVAWWKWSDEALER